MGRRNRYEDGQIEALIRYQAVGLTYRAAAERVRREAASRGVTVNLETLRAAERRRRSEFADAGKRARAKREDDTIRQLWAYIDRRVEDAQREVEKAKAESAELGLVLDTLAQAEDLYSQLGKEAERHREVVGYSDPDALASSLVNTSASLEDALRKVAVARAGLESAETKRAIVERYRDNLKYIEAVSRSRSAAR